MDIFSFDFPKEYETLNVYSGADLHLDDKYFNKKVGYQWRDEILSSPNNYVIVPGDIIDFATKISVTDSYGHTTPDQALDMAVEFLMPLKDRILIITPGNHENRSKKGDGLRPAKIIAQRIFGETEYPKHYADHTALLFISFGQSQGRKSRKMIYSMYLKHGNGGGGTVGGKLSKLAKMEETIDADVFVSGHTHVEAAFKLDRFRTDYRNKKATLHTMLFVNANAFLSFGGYGEDGGYRPLSVDYPVIILTGRTRKVQALV